MAPTLTDEQVRLALRLGDSSMEQAAAARVAGAAREVVGKLAADVPVDVANELLVRLSWLDTCLIAPLPPLEMLSRIRGGRLAVSPWRDPGPGRRR